MSAPQLMMTNTMHLRTESRFCANDSLLFIDLKSIGSIPWTRWLKSNLSLYATQDFVTQKSS